MARARNSFQFEKPPGSNVKVDLAQNIWVTNEDKVRHHLARFRDDVRRAEGWKADIAFLASVWAVLLSDIKPLFGLSGDTWRGIYIAATLYFVISLVRHIKFNWWSGADAVDVEGLARQLCSEAPGDEEGKPKGAQLSDVPPALPMES